MKQLVSIFILSTLLCVCSTSAFASSTNSREVYEEKACFTDLTLKCALEEEAFEEAMRGKFRGHAHIFLEAEEESGVNAVFLASVAAVESGWGKYPTSNNNIFGWNDGEYYNDTFDSVLPTAKKIKELYLSEDGAYFEGRTVEDINIHYNGRPEWEERISKMIAQMENDVFA